MAAKLKILDFRFWGFIFVILLSLFIITQSMITQEEEKREIVQPVTLVEPLYGELVKSYQLDGYVESDDIVTIIPKVSGTLLNLPLDVGEYITKGSIIGIVDSEHLKLQLEQAKVAYDSSKEIYERQEFLYVSNSTSKQNYDQAKTAFEVNRSNYELSKLQLSYTNIESPISGTVLKKHTSPGNLVSPGIPVVTIGTIDRLIFRANIPERFYEYFILKDKDMEIFIVRPDFPYKEYRGIIRYITPVINPETMSFEVLCDFDQSTELLRPGMYMRATFTLDKSGDVYYIPIQCVKDNFIWYVDKESKARRIKLPQGYENASYYSIPEDIAKLDIIYEGFYFLNEGQEVKVITGVSN